MNATATATDRRITIYVAAGATHKVLVEVAGEGFVPSAQVMTNAEAERFLTHVKGRYAGVEIIDAKPQRAKPKGDAAEVVETYVVASQTSTSDGICQNAGDWYSDQVEHMTSLEAAAYKADKQRNDDRHRRNASSRAGYIFRSTIYRIWTAAQYDRYIVTGRVPSGL